MDPPQKPTSYPVGQPPSGTDAAKPPQYPQAEPVMGTLVLPVPHRGLCPMPPHPAGGLYHPPPAYAPPGQGYAVQPGVYGPGPAYAEKPHPMGYAAPGAGMYPQQQPMGAYPHYHHGQQHPPQYHPGHGGALQQPLMMAPPNAGMLMIGDTRRPGFETSICQCNDARTQPNQTCLNAYLFPYCTSARQLHLVEGREPNPMHWACALAMLYDAARIVLPFVYPIGCVTPVTGLCMLNAWTRQRVRSKLHVTPSVCEDYLVSWVLPCCSIAQQQTELRLAGLNPTGFCEQR
jgi:Cys-rich protein (TIGR01571 family)